MSKQDAEKEQYQLETEHLYAVLPTGKRHVSFSELSEWDGCSYRHKLNNIDGLAIDQFSQFMDFGTAVHASIEDFLPSRKMNKTIAFEYIKQLFSTNSSFPGYDKRPLPKDGTSLLDFTINEASQILDEVPSFLEKQFPGWTYVAAEQFLYEPVGTEKHQHAFKGYVDIIIKTTKGKKTTYWIIDVKTCGFGWTKEKKQDPKLARQVALYKYFWAKKMGINMKDVRTAYLLLKRQAKTGQHCELLKVSVGDITLPRHLKVVNNMLGSMKNEIAVKNRTNCHWCEFKNTDKCSGWVP